MERARMRIERVLGRWERSCRVQSSGVGEKENGTTDESRRGECVKFGHEVRTLYTQSYNQRAGEGQNNAFE